ncbi:hypothetical protein D3C79_555410 [compost metagenome]
MLRGLGQLPCGVLRVLHCRRNLHRTVIDGDDQVAQLVDGVVDRVGNGTGEVLGDRHGDGQVAIGQLFDLVEQAHDRLLVALVLFRRVVQLSVGGADHDQADQDDRRQRHQAEDVTAHGVEGTTAGQVLETVGQVRGLVQQGLRQAEDVARRFADAEQLGRGFEDFVHRTGDELEQLGDLGQTGAGIGILDAGHLNRRVTAEHAFEHLTKAAGIAAEGIGSLRRRVVTGQHGVDRAQNTFGQQQLPLGHHHLVGRGAALQQDLDHFFVLDLQLRHGLGQRRRDLMQR